MFKDIPTIVLCGGIGTRLKEETEYRPKPMVEVGGKPLLWHIMKIYHHYGYGEFILALGYKGSYIKDFFLKQDLYLSNFMIDTKTGHQTLINRSSVEDDFRITFVDTGQETLTGERVLRLKPYVRSDLFMCTYGDGLADIDVDDLVAFHKKQGTIGTITGVNPHSRFGLVSMDKNNIVSGFTQKPKLHDYVNGGFMVFDRRFFDYLEAGDLIEDGFLRLVKEKQLSMYTHERFWFCIDNVRDLEDANNLWKQGKPWAIWEEARAHVSADSLSAQRDRTRVV